MKYKNFLLRAVNLLLILGGTVAIPAGGADPGGSDKPAQAGNCRS